MILPTHASQYDKFEARLVRLIYFGLGVKIESHEPTPISK